LTLGAAVTIASAVSQLAAAGEKLPAGDLLCTLSGMLARIAGAHVRQAGTLGGNLVLARTKGLESDLATALLGWGASGGCCLTCGDSCHTLFVTSKTHPPLAHGACPGMGLLLHPPCPALLSVAVLVLNGAGGPQHMSGSSVEFGGAQCEEVPLETFLAGGRSLAPGQLVVAVRLALPAEGDYYWCHKVRGLWLAAHQHGLAGVFPVLVPVAPMPAWPAVHSSVLVNRPCRMDDA
jgi:hypothetical protein